MAINSYDAEKDQLLRDNKRLRDIIPHALESLMISQHASPYIPQERPRGGVGGTNEHPFDDFGNDRNPPVINPATGKPEWAGTSQGLKIAHGEGRGPQPKYHDEYNRELPIPPWMQMFPDGKVREIPWMKEEYLKEHPELAKVNYGKPTKLDNYFKEKGYPNRDQPDWLRLQIMRGAPKA